jgi:phosphohistidine phosphatase
MKHLLIMRHGKADPNKPGQEDIERPLAPRGHEATLSVAKWIERHALLPDVALVSTARRTQETWQVAEGIIGARTTTLNQEALYLASPGEILNQLAGVTDNIDTVIVVAHNPGLENLSQFLAGDDSNTTALEHMRRGFPTAALAVFELAGDSWSNLANDGARLAEFVLPRDLE